MTQPSMIPLSAVEKFDLFRGLSWIVIQTIPRLFTCPFPSSTGPATWQGRLIFPAYRRIIERFSIRQTRCILTPKTTEEVCATFAKKQGLALKTIQLEDGTKAHWIGGDPASASKVLVYFHSGGYTMQMMPGELQFMWNCRSVLQKQGLEAAVLVLSYDLLPEYPFPRQLIQATYLLKYLLEGCHLDLSDIAISGTSAGGNLCLALLSHLSHPHPEVPRLEPSSKFAGMLLVSPNVSHDLTIKSVEENYRKDLIPKYFLEVTGPLFNGEHGVNEYTEAAAADAEWWEGAKVDSVLVLAGRDETLRGGIVRFVERFVVHNKAITKFVLGEKEAHAQTVIDVTLGKRSLQTESAETWIKDQLWNANTRSPRT